MELNGILECESHFLCNKDHGTIIGIRFIVHTFGITLPGMGPSSHASLLFPELCDVEQVT